MKRRVVLKQVMMAAAVAALAPSCTFDKKKASLALNHLNVDGDGEELLAQAVDALIPATDIPGAKSLNVHRFVLKMVDDCYDKEAQDNFVKGLGQLNEMAKKEFGGSFADITASQREAVLKRIETKDDSIPASLLATYPVIKQLTIQGFLTTQYIMHDVQGYEFVPGRFNGCVDVATEKTSA